MPPDTRRKPRVKDPNLLACLKVEYDCCEVTGVVDSLHLHHIVYRSQGGDDTRANIICLDRDFHDRYHQADPVARLMLAEHLVRNRPDTLAYLADKVGVDTRDVWLEQHGVAYEDIHG